MGTSQWLSTDGTNSVKNCQKEPHSWLASCDLTCDLSTNIWFVTKFVTCKSADYIILISQVFVFWWLFTISVTVLWFGWEGEIQASTGAAFTYRYAQQKSVTSPSVHQTIINHCHGAATVSLPLTNTMQLAHNHLLPHDHPLLCDYPLPCGYPIPSLPSF